MCGLGYMHPEWGHGMFHGENQSHYDSYDLGEDPHDPPFLHIQAICDFEMEDGDIAHKGIGVLRTTSCSDLILQVVLKVC